LGARRAVPIPNANSRLSLGGEHLCGVVGADELSSSPNVWLPYVAVVDLDACVERALELRGRSPLRNAEVPGSGRFAVIIDPTGATLAVCEPVEDRTWRYRPSQTGGFCWHELVTDEPGDIATFYQELFGWTLTAQRRDDQALYWYFALDGDPIAGIRSSRRTDAPSALWLCHAEVRDLERTAKSAVTAGGATERCAAYGQFLGRGVLITDPLRGVFCAMVPAVMGLVSRGDVSG